MPITAEKMRDVMKEAADAFQPVHDALADANAEYLGRFWGKNRKRGTWKGKRRPINAIQQLVTTFGPYLRAYKFEISCSSRSGVLEPEAELRGQILTALVEKIGMVEVDRAMLMDAMLGGLGISKTYVRAGSEIIRQGDTVTDPGELAEEHVAIEDFLCDPNATSFRGVQWAADAYVADIEILIGLMRESGMDTAVAEKLLNLEKNEPTGERGVAGKATSRNMLFEQAQLWDVAIYDGSKIYVGVMPAVNSGVDGWVIEPREYVGDESGPYSFLKLIDVRRSPVGMSPAQMIFELHMAMRDAGEQAAEQIRKLKRTNLYPASAQQEAKVVKESADDEWIAVQDPKAYQTIQTGGLLPELQPGLELLQVLLAQQTPNVSLAGGRSPIKSGPATAYAIENQRISSGLNDMTERVQECRRARCRRANWWLDELLQNQAQPFQYQGELERPGGPIQVVFSSQNRRGQFSDFDLDVDVTTATTLDPNARMARLEGAMREAGTFIPVVAKLGGDLPAFADEISRVFKWPGFRKVFPTQAGQQVAMRMASMQPTKQAVGVQQNGTSPRGVFGGGYQLDQAMSDNAPSMARGGV